MAGVTDVVQPKDFDKTKVSFSAPKKNANGGKTIYISYGAKMAYFQTPVMVAPFGISFYPGENGGPDKYSLDLSFQGKDANPSMKAFYEMLAAVDAATLQEAMANSQEWFGKKFPDIRVLEAVQSPSIKMPKTEKYDPRFSMKLPFREGKMQFRVFDNKRQEIDLFDVINSETKGKGARVQAIVQLSCWVVGMRFGVAWKVVQMRWQNASRLRDFAFKIDADDEFIQEEEPADDAVDALTKKLGAVALAAAPKPSAKPSAKELIESSGDEDDNANIRRVTTKSDDLASSSSTTITAPAVVVKQEQEDEEDALEA